MEVAKAIELRHSRRVFDSKPIEWEKILALLDAARLAPSAVNWQPWHFVVVQDEKNRKAIVSAGQVFNKWMAAAPVLIVACAKESHYSKIDLGLSIENVLIRATDLGLSGTPTAIGNKEKISELINCPKGFSPLITIALGYAPEKKTLTERVVKKLMKKKKPIEEIASKEKFGVWL